MHIEELKRNWNALGRKDPLWAILTVPGKKGGKWQIEEFYQTGKHEIDSVMKYARSLNLTIDRRRALDFGCGVGGLTQALTTHFDYVAGVDIARSMLKTARKYNRVGDRCRYILNEVDNLRLFEDGYFNFVYSNIVLQHMEPRYSKSYLREFVRVLAPHGVLIFQLPAAVVQQTLPQEQIPQPHLEQRNLRFRSIKQLFRLCKSRISTCHTNPIMEMYTVPRDEVVRELKESGATVVDVLENDASGPQIVSLRYCVVKDVRN